MRSFADTILRFRFAVLVALALTTGAALWALIPIRYDFSFTTLFVGEGEEYAVLQEYVDRFGSDVNQIVLVLQVDDLFSAEVLDEIRRISAELEHAPGRERVLSLTTSEQLILDQDHTLRQVPLIPSTLPDDPDALARIRADVMAETHVGGLLVSPDGTTTAIALKLGTERTNSSCNDGVDNDGDSLVDCADSSCSTNQYVTLCNNDEPENSSAACTDSKDNDSDDLIDCSDPSCEQTSACRRLIQPGGETSCDDGRDNDENGLADCLDPACQAVTDELCDAETTVRQIRERSSARLAGLGVDARYETAGVPYIHDQYVRTVRRDQQLFIPLAMMIIAIMLLGLFRNLRGAVIPGTVVMLAIVWTGGLMMLTGQYLNMINSVIPTLILVIGVADSIHIMSRYQEERIHRDNRDAVRVTFRHMVRACLLTSLTSAVGFASLLVATLPIIRNFGAYAAIGIGICFVLSMCIVPLALFHWPWPVPTAKDDPRTLNKRQWSTRILDRLISLILKHPLRTGLVSAALVIAACAGIALVHQNSRLMGELREGSPGRVGNDLIEEKLFGILSNAVVIESDRPNGMAEPDVLRAMDEIALWVEQQADPATGIHAVSHAISIADLVKEANVTWFGDESRRRIPDTMPGVVSLLDQLPRDTRERLVSLDYRIAHITMFSRDIGTRGWNPIRRRLRNKIKEVFEQYDLNEHYSYAITGSSTLAQGAIGNIVRDLLSSILLAFGVILVLMTILFRSLRVGLLSMVPNTLPLLCTLGFIGYMGIPLRISTVIIFSVSLGIAVDDTIHFLARLREEQGKGGSYDDALRRTMRGTGRAIVFTTLLLVSGFSILMMSEFVAVHEMGLLGGFTLSVALLGDLVVLPLMLLWLKPQLNRGVQKQDSR